MKKVYEWLMIVLAMVAVSTIWTNTPYNSYIIWTVWGIFFIDFLFQFFKSTNKKNFIKKNPFLILAIVPLDAVFQFARFARVIHLFRLKTITKYFASPFMEKIKRNSMVSLLVLFALIIISSFSLYLFEPSVTSIQDGFLYGFLAVIIFGHADIATVSIVGQVIIISITLIGVFLHGIILGTVFDFLAKKSEKLPFISNR